MSVAWHAYFAALVGVAGGWLGISALVDSMTIPDGSGAFFSLLMALIVLPFTIFGVVAILT